MSSKTVWLIWEKNESNLEKMNRLADKSSAIGILSEAMTTKTISLTLSLKKKSGREFWICAYADSITKSLITKAHKAGIKVNAWTLSNSSQAAKLYKWGIDSITTDGCVNVKNYLESQTKATSTSTFASAGPADQDTSDNAMAAGTDIEESASDAQEDAIGQEDTLAQEDVTAQEIGGQGSEEAAEEAVEGAAEDAQAEGTADQDDVADQDTIEDQDNIADQVAVVDSEGSETAEKKTGEITEAAAGNTDKITEEPAEGTDEITEVFAEDTDEITDAAAEDTN